MSIPGHKAQAGKAFCALSRLIAENNKLIQAMRSNFNHCKCRRIIGGSAHDHSIKHGSLSAAV